ncbi:hypothetical protein CSA37_00515 [Candidatus Fermentibacteria bacterium]|nr:MAG: hypothetical protein CSA37_00515 [Candidatus Fermentibacteria bacterium]
MINRKNDHTATVAALAACVLLIALCYTAIILNTDLDAVKSAWAFVFTGSLAVFFVQSFYCFELAGKIIADEVSSGRVKLWLSLPVSREKLFSIMILQVMKRTAVLSFVMYGFLMLGANTLFEASSRNPAVGLLGVVQVTLMVFLVIVFISLFKKNSTLQGGSISVLLLMHIVQVVAYFRTVDVYPEQYIVFLEKVLTFLLPLNAGYKNIVYGMAPCCGSISVYASPSPWQLNGYSVLWMLFIIAAIAWKTRKFQSS